MAFQFCGVTTRAVLRQGVMTNPVNADQLRVVVEMGDDYEPSERLAAALNELGAALAESDDDVGGFGFDPVRSLVFNSAPTGYKTGGLNSNAFPKVEIFYKVDQLYSADVYKL